MPGSKYNKFKRMQKPWETKFVPYGQGNLPQLANSGTLQNQPATIADLYAQTVQGGLGKGYIPTPGTTPQTPATISGDMPEWAKWGSGIGFGAGQFLNLMNPPSLDYDVPTSIPGLDAMRKNIGVSTRNILNQELEGVRRDATRAGLSDSPGYMDSLKNPSYKRYSENVIQGEAAVSEMEMNAWLMLENMKMEKALMEMQMEMQGGSFGDILSGAAQMLPFLFL